MSTIPTAEEVKARIHKDENGLDFFDHRHKHHPQWASAERDQHVAEIIAQAKARQCEGGECKDINRLCSKHSWEYQRHHGRASNE